MDITIEYLESCRKEIKRLAKKYRSLLCYLDRLECELKENPTMGVDLGHNLHKIRLAVTSKGKGKSGGARVITHVLVYNEGGTVRFLAIYDKSECSTISDKDLMSLVAAYNLE